MHTISSIIQVLSPEEKRQFISVLRKKNKRKDTKNIQLFRLLDTTVKVQQPDVQLYGKKNPGAYHALCKRVQDLLVDFVASRSFETGSSDDMKAIKLLRASRIVLEKKQYRIGFKLIKQALQKAKAFDHFSILNEIYYTYIQYAHHDPSIDLNELISAYTQNKEALQLEERLNLFYATVQQELHQNPQNVALLLSESLAKFDIIVNSNLSFRSLFKILEVGNAAAHVLRDHHSLLPFVITAYEQIDTKKDQSATHLFYHIQIVYFVANAYFRNRIFPKAQYYLTLMYEHMCAQERQYYHRFAPQYALVQALTLAYNGQLPLALTHLKRFDLKPYQMQYEFVLDLQLAHCVLLLFQEAYQEAYAIIKTWHHSDTWYRQKAGMIWVIQKNSIELLLLIELDLLDLVEARLQSFRKKHFSYLRENHGEHILTFIRCTSQWYAAPEQHHDTIVQQINEVLSTHHQPENTEDIFVFTLFIWLQAKITQVPLYPTLLQKLQNEDASSQ